MLASKDSHQTLQCSHNGDLHFQGINTQGCHEMGNSRQDKDRVFGLVAGVENNCTKSNMTVSRKQHTEFSKRNCLRKKDFIEYYSKQQQKIKIEQGIIAATWEKNNNRSKIFQALQTANANFAMFQNRHHNEPHIPVLMS